MMAIIYPLLLSQMNHIQQQLIHSQQQLSLSTEYPEALHELRVGLRKLRSLLKPLRKQPEVIKLDRVMATLIRQSNSVRDMEVLVANLLQKQQQALYAQYQAQLHTMYALLAKQTDIDFVIHQLTTLPLYWQNNLAISSHKKLERRVIRYCQHYQEQLTKLLARQKNIDKHQLRLWVKKWRYAVESYGLLLDVQPHLLLKLKKMQDALGDWHDRWVWLERAKQEEALQILVPAWQAELQYYDQLADNQLAKLLGYITS